MAVQAGTPWGSDVPISMPLPPKAQPAVEMGGFVFTIHGMAHGINPNDLESFFTPQQGQEAVNSG